MAKSATALATETIDDENVLDQPETHTHTTDSGDSASRQTGRITLAAIVFAGALVLAGTVLGINSWNDWRTTETAASRDITILDTATQMATNLVTLRHQSLKEDIQRVSDGTTGTFHDQFTTSSGGFGDVLNEGQVESTGEVKSVGIIDATDDHATVLAAVTSTVKNTEAPDGELRVYRMKMTLDQVDGRWLVSNVEFVA
ncbi:MAG: hypothetical protein WBD41_11215 [Rhodococcus sp. (in: high G+C Gram-positive bacteria)]|jgi:Mce-associated membrane protein|uniref:hypothetical protein n=1 Tax=Rhodococcus TaxID=1827 RepID=UPI0004A930DE|nr:MULTISPECIES: hypothetical protein [Rhodococcus]ANQ75442.1 hypothetical protein AOT96_30755 [Rhodococcus sp. 008]ARE37694.1 hypothetical protein A0W34_29580 [Rhodococcus sp. BH4]KDQ04994.1 membrane protein [Rhodococcus qingshengii]KSU65430.1 hypothetical protein AS032_32680 [Rhodococcus qingshengii]KZF15127.1 hypothetical protein A2J01_32370 [Rhodococcus sp. EPR-134]